MYDDPRNPDLEDAIARDPSDREPYLVLADWLEGCGDPRAALIRAQIADPGTYGHGKAVRKLLADHRAYFIGVLGKADLAIAWRYGYVISIDAPARCDAEHLARALAHPSARFVAFLGVVSTQLAPRLEVVARDAPRTVQHLRLANEGDTDESLAPLATVSGSPSARALLPRLASLSLAGRFTLDAAALRPAAGLVSLSLLVMPRGRELPLELELPALTSLRMNGRIAPSRLELPQLEHAELALPRLDVVAEVRWPKLSTLALRSITSDRPRRLAELFAQDLPLVRLEIHGAPVGDEVCELLAASPFAGRLKTLVLNGADMTDAGVQTLAAHRDKLAALDRLEVRDNAFTEGGLAALDGLGIADLARDRFDDNGE